ncbi:MAG: type II toxin-antitoxin system VapC family toxin [Candidatus Hodarchaeales archaeon]|jgi:predicted nucleic acid-binding protein
MRIYLDICCLNRPFDDQSDSKIHLESEAVLTILDKVENDEWKLIGSEIADIEISKTPDPDRREKVREFAKLGKEKVVLDDETVIKAKELEKNGIKPYDALHLACANKGKADVFLTTDADLIKKVEQLEGKVNIKVSNPLKWLTEVIE